ncbi:hypothetical protein [Acidisphaera sp. L21]|uniref:hypothetical protein n=1 Tax=Acidisphaera sp. L21 TaxID=1641851 RepID=UPI00131A95D0|nr:hypothetical protein [Acidisphaera sp. L21]
MAEPKALKVTYQEMLGVYEENLMAPEVFAQNSPYFAISGNIVSVTLTASRYDNSSSPGIRKQVAVARLSMPVGAAADLATGLYDFLSKNGVKFATDKEREKPQ